MPKTIPDSPARDVYLDLLRLHERVFGQFQALFRRHGLSHVQFNVLRILVEGPAEGLPCQAISERLLNRVPDVTRLIDRMESAGLVERERCTEDRRVVRVRITKEGRRACEALYPAVTALHAEQFAHLSGKELETLRAGLRRALAVD